jgi:hypothetical protein
LIDAPSIAFVERQIEGVRSLKDRVHAQACQSNSSSGKETEMMANSLPPAACGSARA